MREARLADAEPKRLSVEVIDFVEIRMFDYILATQIDGVTHEHRNELFRFRRVLDRDLHERAVFGSMVVSQS